MKLIIDIPEEVYEKQRYSQYFGAWSVVLQKCFENGTPLEKHDEEIIKETVESIWGKPCNDCVSREAVNKLVDELARAISDERCCMSRGRDTATIMQEILDLPSVQPKRDKGDK